MFAEPETVSLPLDALSRRLPQLTTTELAQLRDVASTHLHHRVQRLTAALSTHLMATLRVEEVAIVPQGLQILYVMRAPTQSMPQQLYATVAPSVLDASTELVLDAVQLSFDEDWY